MEINRRRRYRQAFVLDPDGQARRMPERDRFIEIIDLLADDDTPHYALRRWVGDEQPPADPADWSTAITDAQAANLRDAVEDYTLVSDASRCGCTGKHLVQRGAVWEHGCVWCAHREVNGTWALRAIAAPNEDVDELDIRQVGDFGIAGNGPLMLFADLEDELHRLATMRGEQFALITDDASSIVVDPRATPIDVVRAAGDALTHAREQLAIATAAAKTAVRYARAQDVGPSDLARAADVTRATINDWLG